MTSNNSRGFTLIELLVVVAMIAILIGAMTTSVAAARERAKIQRATSEVKIISQAILAYENYARGGDFKLEEKNDVDADSSSLGFLLGAAAVDSGAKMPVLLMAQLRNGGKMLDPWGMPYRVRIKEGTIPSASQVQLRTGYFLPNYYRVSEGER